MSREGINERRLTLHDFRLISTITSRHKNAVKDVGRIYKQFDVNEKGDFERCATLALVFLFGQESVYPSEELDYQNNEKFFERLDELTVEHGLAIRRASSSGRFLELLDGDNFRGVLFFTARKHGIDHVFAAIPTYVEANNTVTEEIPEYVKRFTVVDGAKESVIEIKNLEEMVELYAESSVATLEDGGYGKVVYILSSSEGANEEFNF